MFNTPLNSLYLSCLVFHLSYMKPIPTFCDMIHFWLFILLDIALFGYEMIVATRLVGYPSSHIQRALVGHRQAKVQNEIAVCA